ncbi:MAG: DUF3641 domain-containing protein [Candidatus Manganitrophus sp.]|nr:MAG: DUF3641 domain-containing protein [Candidatus Manganitrophus sp.]
MADRQVEIIASLPYYRPAQTDAQRGEGVFEKSIAALQRLNQLGYGVEGSGLILNLVYNPVGAFLPPKQEAIESQFRKELKHHYGVAFNHLFTITNMPISRFLEFLIETGRRGGLPGAAGPRLQPGRGGRRDVPPYTLGGVGRHPVRL